MELSSIEVIKRLVRIDVGISVVPEISVREDVETKVLTAVRITDLERAPGHDMELSTSKAVIRAWPRRVFYAS